MQKPVEASAGTHAPVQAAKIGLISALIVACCGLLGTALTVTGAALNAYLSSQAAQASVLLTIHATETAEARARMITPAIPTVGAWSTSTGTPATPTPTPGPALCLVKNQLVLPIRVYINGASRGEVAAQSEQSFPLDGEPARLVWEVVKETTVEGRPLGDEMGATIDGVGRGTVIAVSHVVGRQPYFYPIISNRTDHDCEVTINMGWQDENVTNAVVAAKQNDVGLGYFRLYGNSNVILNCGGDLHWWGVRPTEQSGTSFFNDVDPETGTISFTLEP